MRTDLVDLYIFTITSSGQVLLLQLRRAREPMLGSWHPVMGHIEPTETAVAAALRELHEETGLAPHSPAWAGFWQLEQVHPFFMADTNQIWLTPRFAVRVTPGWSPTLNAEHDAVRWIDADHAHRHFLWPGQTLAIQEVFRTILPGGPASECLRIKL